jgi:hypothetical protein
VIEETGQRLESLTTPFDTRTKAFHRLCAVRHWLSTAVARVRSCGICGGQSGIGAGFLRVLWFPLTTIPPTAPHSSSSIKGLVKWAKQWPTYQVDSFPPHSRRIIRNNGFREEISELQKELREDFELMTLDSGTNKWRLP